MLNHVLIKLTTLNCCQAKDLLRMLQLVNLATHTYLLLAYKELTGVHQLTLFTHTVLHQTIHPTHIIFLVRTILITLIGMAILLVYFKSIGIHPQVVCIMLHYMEQFITNTKIM